jgi:hypothetical protein
MGGAHRLTEHATDQFELARARSLRGRYPRVILAASARRCGSATASPASAGPKVRPAEAARVPTRATAFGNIKAHGLSRRTRLPDPAATYDRLVAIERPEIEHERPSPSGSAPLPRRTDRRTRRGRRHNGIDHTCRHPCRRHRQSRLQHRTPESRLSQGPSFIPSAVDTVITVQTPAMPFARHGRNTLTLSTLAHRPHPASLRRSETRACCSCRGPSSIDLHVRHSGSDDALVQSLRSAHARMTRPREVLGDPRQVRATLTATAPCSRSTAPDCC